MMNYRINREDAMLAFAHVLALRSSCNRLQVGAVVTDADMLQVLGIGYNGNVAGGPNHCDRSTPGDCGCVHAELNALLKAPGIVSDKKLFTSVAPCVTCAKAIVNSRVTEVFFSSKYRVTDGIDLLLERGIRVLYRPVDVENYLSRHFTSGGSTDAR